LDKTRNRIVLGFETSCDETSVAMVEESGELIAQEIFSQKSHTRFGGVVPEIAGREHLDRLDKMLDNLFSQTRKSLSDIDLIAVANQPGLIGSLIVGVSYAKALAWGSGIPIIGIHHLQAHIQANFFDHPDLTPPFTALVVSGGHTQFLNIDHSNIFLLGQTRDDAAGEAFDKIGQMLGLDYPAGDKIAVLAKNGNLSAFKFPRAMMSPKQNDFSFSGLKTAVLNFLKSLSKEEIRSRLPDLCASVQEAIAEALALKSIRLMRFAKRNKIVLAGGVAANIRLRQIIQNNLSEGERLFFPQPRFCTDNAAMIALAAVKNNSWGETKNWKLDAKPVSPLGISTP